MLVLDDNHLPQIQWRQFPCVLVELLPPEDVASQHDILPLLWDLVAPGSDLQLPGQVGKGVFDPSAEHHLAAGEGGPWVWLVPVGQLGGEELVGVEGALNPCCP